MFSLPHFIRSRRSCHGVSGFQSPDHVTWLTTSLYRTHCNHHFHPSCLFTYWDDEHRFQNRCPECRTSQGILREKVKFETEREDRCHESDHALEGTEEAQMEAVIERVQANVEFGNMPALMEMWCRFKIEPRLRRRRALQKQNLPGWDEMK